MNEYRKLNYTYKELIDTFLYNDGELIYKVNKSTNVKAGDIAGCVNSNGYKVVSNNGKLSYVHHLVWLFHKGVPPKIDVSIDHKDGDTMNNNISNLREATQTQNNMNSRISSNNKSGIKGVSFHKARGKWVGEIRIKGKRVFHRYFNNLIEADIVMKKKRDELHKEFSRHK